MKLSLNWLQDFITFDKKVPIAELAWRLTEATAEVEKIHYPGHNLDGVVVGQIKSFKKHPDAEKLHVAKVDVGSKQQIQVVFGDKAPVSKGQKVPVAVAPTTLPKGEITEGNIRGVNSQGMLCLNSELIDGLAESLTVLPSRTKVGTPIADVLPVKDVVFEIDNHSITHRADLFSQYGFCREFVALGLAKWKKQYPNYNAQKFAGKKKLPFKVSFENKEMTSSYHGTIVEGLDSRPSPLHIQLRLASCGIRCINALVDITNFVMLEAGAPLHAFDTRAISGNTFNFRLAKKGESMKTLDGKEQHLIDGVMIGESGGRIIDLLGIMGAENSEVKADTKSVYFHMDLCNPVLIRKAMIGLGHRTDAGTMYEKGLDPELSRIGISRCLELTKQLFPKARFHYEMLAKENYSKKKNSVAVREEQIEKHLGLRINKQRAKKILQDLGCSVANAVGGLRVTPPSWRKESLQIPEDIIEEVARINGYSKIPTAFPAIRMRQPGGTNKKILLRKVRNSLMAAGCYEERNFAFLSEDLLNSIGEKPGAHIAEIRNPVSDDFRYLRPSLLPYMLRNAARNIRQQEKMWKTFELGSVFHIAADEMEEQEMATIIITSPTPKNPSFAMAKGVILDLFRNIGIAATENEEPFSLAYPGRSLQLVSCDLQVAKLFQLHPKIQEHFQLAGEVSVVEIPLQALLDAEKEDKKYKIISRYPSVELDISIVVDEERRLRDLQNIIATIEPELLQSVSLVDIFKGKQLGEKKKSVTLKLSYRSKEKTLEEKEVQGVLDTLIKSLEKEGATIRR
jgi:phenylalanyl-tRNA synthetase beta chain